MADTIAPKAPAKAPLDRRAKRVLWLGIVLAVLGAGALLFSMFMWWGGSARDSLSMTFNSWAPGVKTTASGLQYKVLTPGKGKNPTDTDVALVNYEGKLLDGTTFDKSQQPTPMPIKGVVPGFSEALKLMSKGAKFRVWIPAKLGYGDKGAGPIPANATLVFDIELIDFIPLAQYQQIMMQQQQMMQSMGGAGGAGGPSGAGGPPGAGGTVPGGEPAPAPAAPTGK
jgi:hypothetical protein